MRKGNEMVTIRSNDTEKMQEFLELAAAYPEECEVLPQDGDFIQVRIPAEWLSLEPR